ncbi:MAG TPA: NAD(P)/FAD-dependent oxidoreductase [Massilibacterium sp.]|nr:NAD(P)/FAD-dependent oxidoreductase [Massilibacterium sp.]
MSKLVILGGGYGGLRIIQGLLGASDLPKDLEITLIDRVPYHCMKTEFYALAAGTVPDQHIRVPFPTHPQLTFKFGTVEKVELEENKVILEDGEIVSYDDLVIALGCEDKYHGVPGADEYTLSIQSVNRARKTYRTLLALGPDQTVAIVGAGLSGVELASELRESRPDLKIILLDRGEIILSSYPRRLSEYIQSWFVKNGVEVVNNANITKVEKNTLYNNGEPIHCDEVVWTAGVQANKVVRDLDIEHDNSGRAKLTEYHYLKDYENVYVVGDCASLPHPPTAQLAEVQGDQIVSVLLKKWNNEPLTPLPEIKLKGVLGSLGKKAGFGLMGNTALTGRVPRLLKSGVLWMYKRHSS